MTRHTSPRLTAYAALAAAGLLAGLALGRVELVALVAPFALAAVVAPALAREPSLSGGVALERDRALEGETVHATIDLGASESTVVDVFLELPDQLSAEGNPRSLVAPHTLELDIQCRRWGAFVLGAPLVRAHDRLGFYAWEGRVGTRTQLRVYPSVEALNALLPPLETQVFVGNQVSRAKGDGIEFSDIRAWAPGDVPRRINWRATARRGELWVNEQHPERNTDVVLFIDTFTDAHVGGRGTLDMTVRAATSLAHRYLQRKDRVGLVSFGGFLSWLVPASGTRQLYRIVDSLLQVDIILSYAARDVEVLPPRSLPPKALVLALTPLLDGRTPPALLNLRARGFDLVVVEVSPVPFVDPGGDEVERLSYRLWHLSREAMRARYQLAGVPVVEWLDGIPLNVPLEEVAAFRRHARPARA